MKTFEDLIEQIIRENIDLGYKYRMSDYATSDKQEKEMEKEGREEIKKAIAAIKSLISETLEKSKPTNTLQPFTHNEKEAIAQYHDNLRKAFGLNE